jgi:chromosome segregation protein
MKLKSLNIYGFKSFAQRTELFFDKGITGIVGPNGSGKSNIADAVRWVLGEQSPKALRGSKMEDIIFNGTENRKPLPYCEVSLVFDNEDGFLQSEYTEVMVTRRVYRNGEGEYYLNKNACRLKDILELFRDTGVGKEGYSIIGQGRIDDILSAKSEQRRQVFEEAAGIVTYRVRKEEAERKLQKTEENLIRVNDLIDEISLRLEPLKKQAQDAQEYLVQAERLKQLELNIFIIRQERLKQRMQSIGEKISLHTEAIASAKKNIDELSKRRDELDSEQEALDNYESRHRKEQLQISEALQEIGKQEERKQAEIDSLIKEVSRLSEETMQAEQRLSLLINSKNDADTLQKAKENELMVLGEQLAQEKEKLNALENEEQIAQNALDEQRDMMLKAANSIADAKTLEAKHQTMLSQFQERQKQLEDTRQEQEISLEKGRNFIETLESHVKEAEEKAKTLKEKHETLIFKDNANILNIQNAKEKEQKLTQDVNVMQSKLALLNEMSEGYEGYYSAVKQALKFSRGDERVHGVIAKLIQVPKQYETAIDMLLGGQLQHIVTQDEETAKNIINYLRKNRLGRTTFLPITSVKGRTLEPYERHVLKLDGCLGVASELIAFDEQYRGIVENMLGRCVITQDLQSAIAVMRAGKYRFNAVTLQGDVMRSGGSMTGGTSQSQSVSLLGRERQRKELAKQLEDSERLLVSERKKINNLTDEYSKTHTELLKTEKLLNDAVLALALEKEKLASAEQEYKKQEESLNDTLSAQAQIVLALEDMQKDLDKAKNLSKTRSFDQEALHERIKTMQAQLYHIQQKAESQRDIVQQAVIAQQSAQHELDIMQKEADYSEKEQKNLHEIINQNKQSSKEANEKTKELKSILANLSEQYKKLQFENNDMREESVKIDEKRKELNATRKNTDYETELNHSEMNDESEKLHRAELLYARSEDERNTMASNIFSKYEMTYAQALNHRFDEAPTLPSMEKEAHEKRSAIKQLGPINAHAVEEYSQTKARYDDMLMQKNDAQKAQQDLNNLIDHLLKEMETQFTEEFNKLGVYFEECFKRLFGGGSATLKLSDPSSPLTCDIEISAQPPGKRLQLLSLLSGGERALTAIAILFAMLKIKPTPFCVLDEIEAALDDANIGHFSNFLSEFSKTTQFIVVTHRKGTMESCDALYGVAMQEKGVSTMVSVNLEDYKF